jgi:opacity protein-like surface antigen
MMSDYKISSTDVPPGGRFVSHTVGDSMFVGGGVGYEWNSWLRFDVTAEYRAKTQFTALGRFSGGPGPVFVDQFQGNLKSYVFLANAFVDLGTWDCFTPFVGAGIGGTMNTITNFTDVTPLAPGGGSSSFGIGRGTSQFSMAWALYAGLTYNVTKSFKVDLTYRYLNLGSAQDTIDCNGGCGGNRFTFKELHSNDFMLAFRWLCCEVAPPPPRYVYTPPPPPPLQSKG